MSDPDDTPKGTDPVVFKTPTLGHPVRLGELYDQRSGQFLGVQLYAEDSLQVAETDIKHTDLSISLSTTLEDKASLLDIYAKLSLEIMSGMVSVSGSASYIKDTKSNTHEQAFALALKMRLNEKRILFAEDVMGRNVLRVASEDYVATGSATHFVSAIVYGGKFIVNLVARNSKLDEDEKIEGQLEAKFSHLKGAISLEGEARVKITDEFKSMDDKFDLFMHGDVALDRVPINPKDVLEIIPQGASLIREGGGVPISATLQPIPKKLIDARLVYEIDARFVDEVMEEFSALDDLRSRFAVLVDGAKSVEEFVPELYRVVRIVAERYTDEHGALLHDLRKFLYDYQHGLPLGEEWNPDEPGKTKEIPVLKKARELHNRHLFDDYDGHKPSRYYPSTLVGLEKELVKFHYFVSDIQQARDSMFLADSCKTFVSLSSLDTICRFIRLQNRIPLFVMPPFTPKQPFHENLRPDLSLIQFLAILRENVQYFNNSLNPARILYAETVEGLDSRLPNLVEVSDNLERPSLVIGLVDTKGILSWSKAPAETKLYVDIHHVSSDGKSGDLSQSVDGLNGRQSFSLQVVAISSAGSTQDSVISLLRTKSQSPWLRFQMNPFGFVIEQNTPDPMRLVSSTKKPTDGELFVATLVQDVTEKITVFYLENERVTQVFIEDDHDLLYESKTVEIIYPAAGSSDEITWWNGEVLKIRTISKALTLAEIETELEKIHDEYGESEE